MHSWRISIHIFSHALVNVQSCLLFYFFEGGSNSQCDRCLLPDSLLHDTPRWLDMSNWTHHERCQLSQSFLVRWKSSQRSWCSSFVVDKRIYWFFVPFLVALILCITWICSADAHIDVVRTISLSVHNNGCLSGAVSRSSSNIYRSLSNIEALGSESSTCGGECSSRSKETSKTDQLHLEF